MSNLARLAIDFGTSHTVAVLDTGTGQGHPLLFGDSPLLPSAIHANSDGQLLVGRDAARAARTAPECFEPHPKRRIDDGNILLGTQEYSVATLIAEVLKTVAAESRRVADGALGAVAMTHPAHWGKQRLDVLRQAAREAWLGDVSLVPEPEAAAVYFSTSELTGAPPDTFVVYDFGGGTFDVCVLARADGEYHVRAQAGLDDVGGADLDAALLDHMGQAVSRVDAATWQRIIRPDAPDTRRAFRTVYEDTKAAKEQLSRNASALVHVPMLDRDFPVTREEFEQVARPLIEETVKLTADTLSGVGVTEGQPVSLYLVGGSSRVPLVSTLLHRRLRRAPVITGQPEQVVAHGALRHLTESTSDADGVSPVAVAVPPAPESPGRAPAPAAAVPVVSSARQVPPRGAAPTRHLPRERPVSPQQPSPPARSAQRRQPTPPSESGPRKSRRGLLLALGAVLLLVLAAGGYVLNEYGGFPGQNNGTTGVGNEADGANDGGSDANVSEEPAPDSFSECVYPDGSGDGIMASISCGDEAAVYGVTRTVETERECDDATEEFQGYREGVDGVLCMTGLFVPGSCLDGDFNTDSCEDPEAVPYVIREGPAAENTCGNDHEGAVKLQGTEKYYCYDANA